MGLQNSTNDKKHRGAFFTPPAIADFLAEWAINSRTDTILEPSCGEAAFLLSAHRFRESLPQTRRSGKLFGVEIHSETAHAARTKLTEAGATCHIVEHDFFEFNTPEKFDVILGNPPFVRYQTFTGDSRALGLEAAFKQGIRLNRLSSAWAAFLIHSCSFLNATGRMAFVLPAELLSVNYASSVRNYLMNRFASLKIVTFEEIVFPEVQEEVILLLASGQGKTDKFELLQAKNVSDLTGALGRRWSYFKPTTEAEKWTNAFIPEDVLTLYRSCTRQGGFENLGSWGRAYLGAVTGANEFFLLSSQDVRTHKLATADIIKVCPTGTSHLKGLELSSRAWAELERAGKKTFLFHPLSPKKMSKGAAEYILIGEQQKLQERYKCSVRTPWWRVPLVDKPDLFVTYMNHHCIRLIENKADLNILNSQYGFSFSQGRKTLGRELLPIASLNSLTLLGAELEGRSFGGGLLKLEPRDVEKILVPTHRAVADVADQLANLSPRLAAPLRKGDFDTVVQLVDDVLLRRALKFSPSDLKEIRQVRKALFGRRLARNRKTNETGKSHTRGTARPGSQAS